MKELKLTITLTLPDEMPDDEVIRLVQMVIDNGEEAAADTPEDWGSSDGRIIAEKLGKIVVSKQDSPDFDRN